MDDNTVAFAVWDDAFAPAELDALERYGDRLTAVQAALHDKEIEGKIDSAVRITQTAWIRREPEIAWFYDRMQSVAATMNEQVYGFDLDGFSENFQYTVYHGAEGGHYDWHVDQGPLAIRRKLSFTLQLSEPSAYEGCDLQFFAARKIETAPRARGAVIAFPAFVVHRVTACTAGTRKSVVVWTTGPKFR